MARDTTEIRGLYNRLKSRYSERDARMQKVLAIRSGNMAKQYPDLFPTDGPFASNGIVANMVDVAARDMSEVIAPLPTFNCASTAMVSDAARKKAEKRTRIANGYVAMSDLQRQMYTAADRYVTYGFVPGMVELDPENEMPVIRFHESVGSYPLFDRWGQIEAIYLSTYKSRDELVLQFPQAEGHLRVTGQWSSDLIEIVRYHDKDVDALFLPSGGGFILTSAKNPVGKCLAVWFQRPGVDNDPHGQFDDVLALQVAKARFALLSLDAATKAVNAPIVIPPDVQELSLGPDSLLRTSQGEKVRRVPIEIPNGAFSQQALLDQELKQGARYPDARGGNVDGSIVTGRGVQALMSGFDTQIRTAQAMFARGLQDLMELAFMTDERVWTNITKSMRGNDDGTPYQITYTPARDINGDYTVDVQYGLMAGLDPNKALVFGLQARGDKLISRDFLRRQMPFALNATEEEQKLDIEEMRDALKQAVAGYAQAIPVLAQNGQDPGEVLSRLSEIIKGRQKGTTIEEIISAAFTVEPPPAPEMGMPPEMGGMPGMPPEMGGAPGPGPGNLEGINPMGQMQGIAAGQAGMGPGGRPDVQTLLAGLTGRGEANLQAGVSRRLPI